MHQHGSKALKSPRTVREVMDEEYMTRGDGDGKIWTREELEEHHRIGDFIAELMAEGYEGDAFDTELALRIAMNGHEKAISSTPPTRRKKNNAVSFTEHKTVMTQSPKRIVVKVGTSTLTDPQGGMDRGFIADLAAQIAAQTQQGRELLLVSSGAIRAGRETLPNLLDPANAQYNELPFKQACAAIGQGVLMHIYHEAFAWRKVQCAQILLTRDDLGDTQRVLNARNTLQTLLELGAVPIINENDTVAVDEIKFGDNDTLAARVAVLVEADLLIILSDIDGLYDRSPEKPDAKLIHVVHQIDSAIAALGGDSTSGMGTGGMRTKIEAARIALAAGIRTVIAQGRREKVIAEVISGAKVGTTFLPDRDGQK